MNKIERANLILNNLNIIYPKTRIPLKHKSIFELLIAVVLSAQCTDERVNKVTPLLFAKANNPFKMQNIKQVATYSMMIIWVAFLVNLISPIGGNLGLGIYWLGVVMLALHVFELVVVYSKLKAINHGTTKDVINVLAFGVLYWKPLLSK